MPDTTKESGEAVSRHDGPVERSALRRGGVRDEPRPVGGQELEHVAVEAVAHGRREQRQVGDSCSITPAGSAHAFLVAAGAAISIVRLSVVYDDL